MLRELLESRLFAEPFSQRSGGHPAPALPVALSFSGGDSSFRQLMAIVVIGGLMTSTVLSPVAIPVIFTFVDDFLGLLKLLVCLTQPEPSPAFEPED